MSMETKNNTITTDDALLVLEEAKQKRRDAVIAKIQESLEKYNCEMDISVTLRRGQIEPIINIIAKD